MKWPGISLRTMMFVVAILAVDFGFFSSLWDLEHFLLTNQLGDVVEIVLIGLLPMANVIIFSLPRLLCRVRRSPFSIGFQVTSWVSTIAVLSVFFFKIEVVIDLMDYLDPALLGNFYSTPGLMALRIVPPAEAPPFELFESLCNVLLGPDGRPEIWICSIEFMAFFSLPPLLVSLAGGLATRFVVRRRGQAKSV